MWVTAVIPVFLIYQQFSIVYGNSAFFQPNYQPKVPHDQLIKHLALNSRQIDQSFRQPGWQYQQPSSQYQQPGAYQQQNPPVQQPSSPYQPSNLQQQTHLQYQQQPYLPYQQQTYSPYQQELYSPNQQQPFLPHQQTNVPQLQLFSQYQPAGSLAFHQLFLPGNLQQLNLPLPQNYGSYHQPLAAFEPLTSEYSADPADPQGEKKTRKPSDYFPLAGDQTAHDFDRATFRTSDSRDEVLRSTLPGIEEAITKTVKQQLRKLQRNLANEATQNILTCPLPAPICADGRPAVCTSNGATGLPVYSCLSPLGQVLPSPAGSLTPSPPSSGSSSSDSGLKSPAVLGGRSLLEAIAGPESEGKLRPTGANNPSAQGYLGTYPLGLNYPVTNPHVQGTNPQGTNPLGPGNTGINSLSQGNPATNSPHQVYLGAYPLTQNYPGINLLGQGYTGTNPLGPGYTGITSLSLGQGYQGTNPTGQGFQGTNPVSQGTQWSNPPGQGYPGTNPLGHGYTGTNVDGPGYTGINPLTIGQGYQGINQMGPSFQGTNPLSLGTPGSNPPSQGYPGTNQLNQDHPGSPGSLQYQSKPYNPMIQTLGCLNYCVRPIVFPGPLQASGLLNMQCKPGQFGSLCASNLPFPSPVGTSPSSGQLEYLKQTPSPPYASEILQNPIMGTQGVMPGIPNPMSYGNTIVRNNPTVSGLGAPGAVFERRLPIVQTQWNVIQPPITRQIVTSQQTLPVSGSYGPQNYISQENSYFPVNGPTQTNNPYNPQSQPIFIEPITFQNNPPPQGAVISPGKKPTYVGAQQAASPSKLPQSKLGRQPRLRTSDSFGQLNNVPLVYAFSQPSLQNLPIAQKKSRGNPLNPITTNVVSSQGSFSNQAIPSMIPLAPGSLSPGVQFSLQPGFPAAGIQAPMVPLGFQVQEGETPLQPGFLSTYQMQFPGTYDQPVTQRDTQNPYNQTFPYIQNPMLEKKKDRQYSPPFLTSGLSLLSEADEEIPHGDKSLDSKDKNPKKTSKKTPSRTKKRGSSRV